MSAAEKVKLLPFELEVVSGPHLGQKYAFVDKLSITMGRGTENDICLQHDPRVSRVHAEIKQENEMIYIYNKTNKNSLLVNGRKEDQVKILQSCVISIGETELKFIYPQMTKSLKSPLQALPQNPMPVGLVQPSQLQPPGPMHTSGYPQPHMPSAAPTTNTTPRRRKIPKKQENFNSIFLVVIVAAIIAIVFVLPSKPDDKERVERSPDIVTPIVQEEKRFQEAQERAREALNKLENQNSRQTMAQQFFVSGMREFLNGNYQRAVSFLNSAYQSDPTLIEAEKFARDAQRKLDRMIDLYFAEGLKYRENSNFRMCKSSFQTVQLYIRNNLKHPRYIEAKQFYDECANLDKVRRF
ncbi:MAG: FHA domain-containing protein [Bdellovibrionaceae bacterium]|nr:FHA domain-containing protein [Pseudobdellovibrionaceae bacterium]